MNDVSLPELMAPSLFAGNIMYTRLGTSLPFRESPALPPIFPALVQMSALRVRVSIYVKGFADIEGNLPHSLHEFVDLYMAM